MNKNLIFIVAYNHQDFIQRVIARIPDSLLEDPQTEVLIIDDASADDTFVVTEHIRRKLHGKVRIAVIKNPINQGYGGNQKLGFRYAIDNGFERVFLVHGDGQYDPALLPKFIEQYDKDTHVSAVFGTRMFSLRSARKGGMPYYKMVGNRILTWIQNALLKSSLSEFHSGYRSYSTALLSKIPFEANSNDFHFDSEIIIQALSAGALIREIPIPTHYGNEICHVNGIQYAWNVLMSTLHFRLFKVGFLYDRKFDIPNTNHYLPKETPYSSHSQIINAIAPGEYVLDLGCGAGSISVPLVKKGCRVDGVDFLPQAKVSKLLNRYYQIDLNQNLDRLKEVLESAEYDVIVLADIIEHMVEPEKFLDFIRSYYTPRHRCRVVASTGNVGFVVVRLMLGLGQFNYGPRGILDRTHTRLFTKKSFRHLFEQASFRVSDQAGIPLPFSSILGSESKIARGLEAFNAFLARWIPGLFAYQLLLTAEAMPTVKQILKASTDHSEDLRRRL